MQFLSDPLYISSHQRDRVKVTDSEGPPGLMGSYTWKHNYTRPSILDKDSVRNSGRADFTEVVILWFLNAERKKERLKGILCRSDSEYDGRRGWQPPHV